MIVMLCGKMFVSKENRGLYTTIQMGKKLCRLYILKRGAGINPCFRRYIESANGKGVIDLNDFSTLIAAGAAGLMLGIVSPLVAYLKVRRKKKKYQFKSEPVSKKITADRRYLNGRRDHSTEEY